MGGNILDVSPHHHAVEYFPALSFERRDVLQFYDCGLTVPLYRETVPSHVGDHPNPHHDAVLAESYAQAKRAADEHCRTSVERR